MDLDVKVVYLDDSILDKKRPDSLFNRFLEDAKGWDDWSVASYPMLGPRQFEYIRYMTWPGFTPVGQAVVRFDLQDVLSQAIFEGLKLDPLPEGYHMTTYMPAYERDVTLALAEAFESSVDALWDPRFRSLDGMKECMQFVQSGAYGLFYPNATAVLLNPDKKAVGACLLNVVSPTEANIPMIGLLKSERGKKLGQHLLAHTVRQVINLKRSGQLPIKLVSATVATGNLSAVRMYRHIGFQEAFWYPHLFQERNRVMSRRPGQWC
ncbi:MAG: hypothetical protein R2857_01805 [Vampirovibrionales bacterium]